MRPSIPLIALALACAMAPIVQAAPQDENPAFSRPRRASGTSVVRPREGSLPFDGDWSAFAAVPIDRRHYRWSPEFLDAARREAFVSPDVADGVRLGSHEASGGGQNVSRAPLRGRTFDGLNRETSGYQGFTGYPPDPNLAVSQTKILQATNIAVRLTTRDGLETDRVPLNNFLGFPGNSVLFDPKVFFDRLSGRFFLVALEQSDLPRKSGIWIAVSKNSNPTALSAPSNFCTYRISGNRGGSWADYPTVGVNEEWFAIAVNNFRFSDGTFRSDHVYVLPIDQVTANASSCPPLGAKRFDVRRGPEDEPVFGIHPAQHYTTNQLPGTPLFMLSTPFSLPATRYTLWQITTNAAGVPMISHQVIEGDFSYSFTPTAPQRDGDDLDSGDPRITQAAFRAGKLWGVQGVGCAIDELPNEGCVRAFQVTPTAAGPASITFSQTYGLPNTFLFWPGIAVNGVGDVLVVAMRARAGNYLRTVYNGKQAGETTFDGLRNLGTGNCPLDNPAGDEGFNRTGDYVGLQADPLDNLSFWFTGELPGNIGPPFGCDWKTKVARTKY